MAEQFDLDSMLKPENDQVYVSQGKFGQGDTAPKRERRTNAIKRRADAIERAANAPPLNNVPVKKQPPESTTRPLLEA